MSSFHDPLVPAPSPRMPYNSDLDDQRRFDREFRSMMEIINDARIRTVFQPIINMKTAEVYCYEALSRIEGDSPFPGPSELFHAAQVFQVTEELERLCRTRAIESARERGVSRPLCVNVCPSILQQLDNDVMADAMFRELFSYRGEIPGADGKVFH